jgi:hypothetical protein
MFGVQVSGGHLATEKILSSPYIDYLSAPLSYEICSRKLGGTGQQRGLTESCRLNGKLWLDEVDHPTFLGDCFERESPEFRQTNLDDSVSVMWRNAMSSFSRGMGMWWYDFGPKGNGGWWDDKDLLREIKEIKSVTMARLNVDYQSQADVLLVYDNDVFYYLNNSAKTTKLFVNAITNTTSADFYHSGAVFDIVFLSDLTKVDISRYKAVVFANTFAIDKQQRDYIRKKIAKDGRTLIWLYAPGFINKTKCDANNIIDATGIGIAQSDISQPAHISVAEKAGIPAAKFGLDFAISPLFSVIDGNAQSYGVYAGTSNIALAKKKLPDSTAWFCGLPLAGSDLMRAILKEAGVHIYDDNNDVVYSGNGILCVHTLTGGARKLVLKSGNVIDVVLSPRSTKVFDNVSGSVIH